MLTVTLDKPGSFSAREDGAEPVRKSGEALVRVHRIGVCGTDLHAFAGRQPFFEFPRVLGHELGVEIIDPGDTEGDLRAGDRCAVEPYLNCGTCVACRRGKPNCCASLTVMGVHIDGGMRPYISVPHHKLHRANDLEFDQLALVETLAIGAHAVSRASPGSDDFVLVIGAGPIGLSVIPFAVASGARVAVMDLAERRLALAAKQNPGISTLRAGADAAADLRGIGEGDLPSVIIDATGNRHSMASTFDLAAPGGSIVFVGLFPGELTFDDPNFHRREITLMASRNARPDDFNTVIGSIRSGRVDTKPWITHRLGLPAVPELFPGLPGDENLVKAMISVS